MPMPLAFGWDLLASDDSAVDCRLEGCEGGDIVGVELPSGEGWMALGNRLNSGWG